MPVMLFTAEAMDATYSGLGAKLFSDATGAVATSLPIFKAGRATGSPADY